MLGNRPTAAVRTVLLEPGPDLAVMPCRDVITDMLVRGGGDPGLRATVAVGRAMHQPVVRHDALPVALVPEPVGMATGQVHAALTWTRSATLW